MNHMNFGEDGYLPYNYGDTEQDYIDAVSDLEDAYDKAEEYDAVQCTDCKWYYEGRGSSHDSPPEDSMCEAFERFVADKTDDSEHAMFTDAMNDKCSYYEKRTRVVIHGSGSGYGSYGSVYCGG